MGREVCVHSDRGYAAHGPDIGDKTSFSEEKQIVLECCRTLIEVNQVFSE